MSWRWWPLLGTLIFLALPAQAQLPNALFSRSRSTTIQPVGPSLKRTKRPIRVAQQTDLFDEAGTFESVNRFQADKQLRSIKRQLPKPNSQYKSLLTRPIAKPRFKSPSGNSFRPIEAPNPGELSKLEFDDPVEKPSSKSSVAQEAPTERIPRGAGSDPIDFDVSKPVEFEETEFPASPLGPRTFDGTKSDLSKTVGAETDSRWKEDGPYSLEPSTDPLVGGELLPDPQPYSGRTSDTGRSLDRYRLEPEPALPNFDRATGGHSMSAGSMSEGMSQDLPWTGYSENASEMGPVQSSPDLLYGGYGGLVDSYVNQLLAGGGNSTYTAVSDFGPSWTSPIVSDFGGCGSVFIAPSGWYADIKALVLNPTNRGRVDVSNDATGLVALNTRDFDIGWSAGVDARVGFRTGASAIEFGWWSLFPASDSAEVFRPAGGLLPAINFDFPAAELHRIENQLEVHSIDVRHVLVNSLSDRLSLGVWWGLRFTRIREEFQFESDQIIAIRGDERRYDLEVDNRMIGPQFGGIGYWQLASRLGLRVEAQIGAYYNYISQQQRAGNDIGAFPFPSGPDAGRPFDVETSTSTASAISEFNFGLEYQLRPRLRLMAGYRLVAAAGIARTISQIPDQQGAVYDLDIDARDSLLLHGFELGVDFSF